MAIIEGVESIKVGGQGIGEDKPAIAAYDFAVDGGAVGAITLRGDSIPSGAVIIGSLLIVDTVLASSGSATAQVGTEGAADIAASAAYNAAPWSTTGAKRGSMTATTAPITTTAKRSITLTVGTAALTGGKFRVIVWYVEAP